MRLYLRVPFLLLFCAAAIVAIVNTVHAQGRIIKWQGIISNNDEFVFLIPEGFQTSDDGAFELRNRAGSTHLRFARTVSRYTKGVVLMVQIYEGKGDEIQSMLSEVFEKDLIKQGVLNGFQFKYYLTKGTDFTSEQQHFFNKKFLYIATAAYREDRGTIVDAFFKSLRLINGEKAAAPNLADNAGKVLLNASPPDIIDIEPDSTEIVESPDKKAVLLYLPRPSFRREFGKSNSGKLLVNALVSASGKVIKVELVSSPNLSLYEGARASVQHAVFLPALQSGKAVTSWHRVEYGFQISRGGF